MRKPSRGWPRYRTFKSNDPDALNLSHVAVVCLIWACIGLLTSWYYSGTYDTERKAVYPAWHQSVNVSTANENRSPSSMIGPIQVDRRNSPYQIQVYSDHMPSSSWSYIQGEVLDVNKEYLFSFGSEMYHETGRDSDGPWTEKITNYRMKITFPEKGTYYLHFVQENNYGKNKSVNVAVSKMRGSALPHLWFAIFAVILAVILNEIRNRTVTHMLRGAFDD